MSQLLLIEAQIKAGYNRIKYLNRLIETSTNDIQYKPLRNNGIADLLVLKRRRNRLLGIIKEWYKMINELKIFLDQYKIHNENKLLTEKDEIEQAVFFGHIKNIEAVQNMITYLEEQEWY